MTFHNGAYFDHYQICSHVAQGGTADVYQALDPSTGRTVALKIPLRSTILNPALYEQFLREVEAMRILQHPSVQRGLESGRWESTPFLVTAWIDGQSLRHALQATGPFSLERALVLIHRIGAALQYCHEHGVVHRDLKPENVLLIDQDQPILIDFGLALTPAYPGAGRAAGTPDYMAPEQIEEQCGDHRIDLYALGVLLYELLAGAPPFTGTDSAEVLMLHLYARIPRLDHVRTDLSPQLAAVVATCLQRDPDRRYPDIPTFLRALDHLDQVEVRYLDDLTAPAPKPSFFKTQFGQVAMMLIVFIALTAFLTVAAVTFKH